MKSKARIIINVTLSLLLLLAAVVAARWMVGNAQQPQRQAPHRPAPRVLAPPIQPIEDYRVELTGFGSARPAVRVPIAPQVGGQVVDKAENFLSGRYVREGQMLIQIERADYQLTVDRLSRRIELLEAQLAGARQERENLRSSREIEAQRLELATSQVQRVRNLIARGASSQNELDNVREAELARAAQLQSIDSQLALIDPRIAQLDAEIASLTVELRQAELDLQRTTVRSPVTGRVIGETIDVGEQAGANAPVGEVYGAAVMEAPVSIASADLEWIDPELLERCQSGPVDPDGDPNDRIGATVYWRRPGQADADSISWPGCVDRMEAGLEEQTRTAVLVVRVVNEPLVFEGDAPRPAPTEPRTPRLDVNMFCRAVIAGRRVDRAYLLPRGAIGPDGSVYLAAPADDGDGYRLRRAQVTPARLTGEQALVLPNSGLAPGDRVVVGALASPVVGMRVVPVDSPAALEAQPAPAPGAGP